METILLVLLVLLLVVFVGGDEVKAAAAEEAGENKRVEIQSGLSASVLGDELVEVEVRGRLIILKLEFEEIVHELTNSDMKELSEEGELIIQIGASDDALFSVLVMV